MNVGRKNEVYIFSLLVTRKASNWAYEHVVIMCDIELGCHSEIDIFMTKCTQSPCQS